MMEQLRVVLRRTRRRRRAMGIVERTCGRAYIFAPKGIGKRISGYRVADINKLCADFENQTTSRTM
jgi:hypothetical protein